jgi:hypothetical protein
MKLIVLPAILLLTAPAAEVRFETEGVRVGTELVTARDLGLKEAGTLPVLVSGSVVENLSATGTALAVGLAGDRTVSLASGVRLARAAEGFRLSTHGPALVLEAGGKTLAGESSLAFKLTEKGFDFGALGTLDGASLAVRPAAPALSVPPQQQRFGRMRPLQMRYVFGNLDPGTMAEFAGTNAIRQLLQVTPTGSP